MKAFSILLTVITLGLINFYCYNWLWDRFYYNQVNYYYNNTWKMTFVTALSENEIVLKFGNNEYVYVFDQFGYLKIYDFDHYSIYDDFNTLILKENSKDWLTINKFKKIKTDANKKLKKHLSKVSNSATFYIY
jgi:hypothetical protein